MKTARRLLYTPDRWLPLLLTVSYAVLGGLSLQYFHDSIAQDIPGISGTPMGIVVADALYALFTLSLIVLLVIHLVRMIGSYETALETSEARLRALINASADFVWEIDAHFAYTFVNPAVHAVLGYTSEEMLGKTPN